MRATRNGRKRRSASRRMKEVACGAWATQSSRNTGDRIPRLCAADAPNRCSDPVNVSSGHNWERSVSHGDRLMLAGGHDNHGTTGDCND